MRLQLTLALSLVAVVVFSTHSAHSQTPPVWQFNFPKFTASDELQFNVISNPIFGPETLSLLSYDPLGGDERIELGVVYYKQRVKLEHFNVTFTVRMSNLSRESMGNPDGFAFVVQNSRANAYGAGAGGLGYGATPEYDDLGVRRSVAIEFDTFMNEELGDPNANHISVHHSVNDSVNSASEEAALYPPGPVTDVPLIAGYTHKYNIIYRANVLSVYIDDSAVPAYYARLDIASIIALNASGAYVGLTTSCRSKCEDVEVLEWYFNALGSPVDASKTYVVDATRSVTAGSASTIIVQTVDYDGDLITTGGEAAEFTASITPLGIAGSVPMPAVSVVDHRDGTYLIRSVWTTAGSYDVTVKFDGRPIANMPVRIKVSAGALSANSSQVIAATSNGVAGEQLNIVISATDSYGNVISSNETFVAVSQLTGQEARSTFVGNGIFLIQLLLTTAATHPISVYLNNVTWQDIRGSPFNVTIAPAVPDAAASLVSGNGTAGGVTGAELPVVVRLRDRFLNDIDANQTDVFFTPLGVWDQAAYNTGVSNVTFMVQADGTFTGHYSIDTTGQYRLTFVLGYTGDVIANSSFLVIITSPPCAVPDPRPIMPPTPLVWASTAGTGTAALLYGGAWNSKSYASEIDPVWFEIDFGQDVRLAELRLKVEQKPAAAYTFHTITGGVAGSTDEVLARLAGVTYHNEMLVVPINQVVRVFRVTTTVAPSWVAWGSVLAAFTPIA